MNFCLNSNYPSLQTNSYKETTNASRFTTQPNTGDSEGAPNNSSYARDSVPLETDTVGAGPAAGLLQKRMSRVEFVNRKFSSDNVSLRLNEQKHLSAPLAAPSGDSSQEISGSKRISFKIGKFSEQNVGVRVLPISFVRNYKYYMACF